MSEESNDTIARLNFLAKMALLLNSALDTRRIIAVALQHLQGILNAEAATVFCLEPGSKEIVFWALPRTDQKLLNKRLPLGKGIVGWVIENKQPLHVKDVSKDPRFFNAFDSQETFITREILCVPLVARGNNLLGALQVLNPLDREHFDDEDLSFVEQCAQQLSLALENAQLYEALREQNLKLEVLGRRKSEIASVISHEFRTPLNIIRTAAELIVGPNGDSEAFGKEISDALFKGVDRLSKIVAEITNLSLVEQPNMEIEKEKISAAQLVEDVANKFKSIAKERSLDLRVESQNCKDVIEGDRALLVIVLCNLVVNAIRFTPDGGSIKISCKSEAQIVEFVVEDTGIGIPKEEIPLIFEKFYEVQPAVNHSSGDYGFKSCGLGLGLATATSILKSHTSKLHVQSEEGKGSRFSFSLAAV